MKRIQVILLIAAIGVISALAQDADNKSNPKNVTIKTGVLLLAHGGKPTWNAEVMKVAAVVNQTMPVEVAFGMASKRSIQQAIDKLVARGSTDVLTVPLFISSNSSVITSTEFLLGLRHQAPADLAIFAKMDHGHGMGHSGHGSDQSIDPTTPVNSTVPIRMLPALNSHPLVAEILLSRAKSISREPKKEVVVVVAHGPVSDDENNLWLSDMRQLVKLMSGESKFKRIEYLTVRDDAPEPLRSQAAEELRRVVRRASNEGNNALVVPLLLSYGGIEEGVKKRLEGLTYTMTGQALLPDERLSRWVLESVEKAAKTSSRMGSIAP
ncbi:MAG: sirohydrochlorin chelatase [Pyrinomonadaceae bacterium]